jgi:signal transduction histidine kinase
MAMRGSARFRTVVAEDLPLALLATGLLLIGSGVSLEDDFDIDVIGDGPLPWVPGPEALVLVLVGGLPLTFRRVAPVSVFILTACASLGYQALVDRPEPLPIGALFALYTLATARRPLVCTVAASAYLFIVTLAGLVGTLPITDDQYYIDLVSVVATVMLGYGVALSRARARLAEQRATELIREQDVRTQAALAQEQARIAREVHDIVAHDVSVIVAQASAARRVFPSHPQAAAQALASIETVGRDALDGLRRIVTLLRTDLGQDDRSPQPSLERLPWLISQVECTGLPIDLTVRGRPRSLSATVELNAFRIVQEALTNILKHAGPTRATVVLTYGDRRLLIEVRDRGRGVTGTPSPGYGLISMQQRAAMLGGELVAEPADGGFVVRASLPTAHDAETEVSAAPSVETSEAQRGAPPPRSEPDRPSPADEAGSPVPRVAP